VITAVFLSAIGAKWALDALTQFNYIARINWVSSRFDQVRKIYIFCGTARPKMAIWTCQRKTKLLGHGRMWRSFALASPG
jgi:hypothetical protein